MGKIVEMLIGRGARVHTTNMGDDTPLHLATAHGHKEVVQLLLRHKADVNFVNEHGNSAMHYACFWGYTDIAEELVDAGALVAVQNKYQETPLDKCSERVAQRLHDRAAQAGQDLRKKEFKDQSWLGLKTRSRDATLSRHKGININELYLHTKIATTPSGETWRGKWQGNEIAAKILALRECTPRISRDFNEEYPKLRIFSHKVSYRYCSACSKYVQKKYYKSHVRKHDTSDVVESVEEPEDLDTSKDGEDEEEEDEAMDTSTSAGKVPSKIYNCVDCTRMFMSAEAHANHLREVHGGEGGSVVLKLPGN